MSANKVQSFVIFQYLFWLTLFSILELYAFSLQTNSQASPILSCILYLVSLQKRKWKIQGWNLTLYSPLYPPPPLGRKSPPPPSSSTQIFSIVNVFPIKPIFSSNVSILKDLTYLFTKLGWPLSLQFFISSIFEPIPETRIKLSQNIRYT